MIQYFPIVTGSLTVLGNINVSGSITTSGSITISGSITSASFATSASNATNAISASYANNLTVAGTLTAQTIVVQTITSSVDYITGSSINGSLSTNTHLFTGSVSISGSSTALNVNSGAFFISSSGNIGIGTTISNAGSSVSGTTVVTIAPQSSVSERWGILELAGNRTLGENQVGEIKFTNINTTNNVVASISGNNTTTGVTGGFLNFSTKTDAGSLTERMRITPSGSVGIGTTSPAFKLQVGNQNVSASLVVGSYAGANPEYVIMGSENNGYGSSFFYRDMSTRAFPLVKIWINNASDTQYPLDVQTAASPATIGLKTDSLYNSIIRDYTTTTTSTLDITTERTDGGGFNFLLLVSSTLVASGANRNYYTFAVQGRGTTATASQLSNVSAGTSSRTAVAVSFPSNGVIRLTLTGGESCLLKVTAIGHGSL